ncbi:MAG TPA: hypothetical protein VGR28_02155 [Candidatus Thermoplasmatota archaeon]|jgi:hypothetical protein|nr:hypothetical protein [Candidatus Thermoplasmatota archaeon]
MTRWKDALKRGMATTGKAIATGTKTVATKVAIAARHSQWRDEIIGRMSERQAKNACTYFGVERYEILGEEQNWKSALASSVDLVPLLEYAKKRGIRVDDIEAKLKAETTAQDATTTTPHATTPPKATHVSPTAVPEALSASMKAEPINETRAKDPSPAPDLLQLLGRAIQKFPPQKQLKAEKDFRNALHSWLMHDFPQAVMEKRSSDGRVRPDIVVETVAIEIKGPTSNQALRSIYAKCVEYSPAFPGGLVIVLFRIQDMEYFESWRQRVVSHFPHVVVIARND